MWGDDFCKLDIFLPLLDLNQATDVLYCDDQGDDDKPIQESVKVSAFGSQDTSTEDAFATNNVPFTFCDPYDIEDLQVWTLEF